MAAISFIGRRSARVKRFGSQVISQRPPRASPVIVALKQADSRAWLSNVTDANEANVERNIGMNHIPREFRFGRATSLPVGCRPSLDRQRAHCTGSGPSSAFVMPTGPRLSPTVSQRKNGIFNKVLTDACPGAERRWRSPQHWCRGRRSYVAPQAGERCVVDGRSLQANTSSAAGHSLRFTMIIRCSIYSR